MSYIKHEDDTQSNVSVDLSEEYCEDESLLQATDFRNSFLKADDAGQPLAEEVFYTKPSLNLLDGTFFKYIPEKSTNNKLVAFCMKCYPLPVEVKGYGSCTSNFISHLKRRHGDDMVAEYREYMKSKRRRVNHDQVNTGIKTYQQQMQEYAASSSPTVAKDTLHTILEKSNNAGTSFLENIANFFISSLLPTNILENANFRKIFQDLNLPAHTLQAMTQRSLEDHIKQRHQHIVANMTHKLNELENPAVSLHLWHHDDYFFIGVVVHWLEEQDLRRKSCALAVRKLERKNFNIESIPCLLKEFGERLGNSQAVIIGNVRNYLKEYTELGVDIDNVISEQALDVENNIYCVDFDIPLDGQLPSFTPQFSCAEFLLIKALRCAFEEMLAATKNTKLSSMHANVMAYCNLQWQAARANVMSRITCPLFNDWRSLFRSLEQIATLTSGGVGAANSTLKQNEINYIYEFLRCTSPITEALNILQTDNNSYFGMVLPCLFALKRKLNKISKSQSFEYCQPLLEKYLSIISNYFQEYYALQTESAKNAAIAALSYPRFKNQWFVCLEQPQQRAELLQNFKKAISEHMIIRKPDIKNEPAESRDFSDSFFDFGDEAEETSTSPTKPKSKSQISLENMVEAQVSQYFAEDCADISILHQYPEIKKVFMQYNTPLASLALGEQFFDSNFMKKFERNHKQFNPLTEARLILKAQLDCAQH